MVMIRMARRGRKKCPIFSIVATDSRSPRDGRFLERLGQYNPGEKTECLKQLKTERMAYWVKNGAIISDSLKSLLKKYKIQINL